MTKTEIRKELINSIHNFVFDNDSYCYAEVETYFKDILERLKEEKIDKYVEENKGFKDTIMGYDQWKIRKKLINSIHNFVFDDDSYCYTEVEAYFKDVLKRLKEEKIDYTKYDKYVEENKWFEDTIMGYDQWINEKLN